MANRANRNFLTPTLMRLGLAVFGLWLSTTGHAQDVTLNLKDADITALINTVAEVTGKNFVVDPRVQGKVTVISSQPMDHRQLYRVFLSILEVQGFAAVDTGEVITIVPTANAKTVGGDADDTSADIVTQVIAVHNLSAAQLVPILRPLIPQFGHLAAQPDGNVIIISDRAANVERLRRIIERIDVPGGREAEVVGLQNASAEELVRVLGSLDGPQAADATARVRMVADMRTNSILLSGDEQERLRLRSLITHLDTPEENSGNTHVVYLKYADAEQLAPLLTNAVGGDSKEPGGRITRIQADPSTNSLIITAPPDGMTSLRSVLRQLDIRRVQVHVEAIIAEISSDLAQDLGVQWIVDGSRDGGSPVAVTNFGGPGSSIVDLTRGVIAGTPLIGSGTSIAVGRFGGSGTNFAGLLRALNADSATNVLSTPSLTTLDNEEAEIVVGQSVPFITGQFTNTGTSESALNPFQTIQREDVGLQLRVRPQINEGSAIKLELEQEVSSLAQQAGGGVAAADLITNKRSIRTTVMIEDGQVVVLGGLIDDNTTDVVERVPLLGSMPVIGRLFRFTSSKRAKRNLMVFLQPSIVRNAQDNAQITGNKYNYFRDRQFAERSAHRDGIDSNSLPLLKPLEEYLQEPSTTPLPPPE